MEELTVVGIQKIKAKTGKKYTKFFCLKEFTEYDKGAVGQGVQELFLEGEYPGVDIGSVIIPVYAPGFRGECRVVDINVA